MAHILVVDDSKYQRTFLENILKQYGHTVVQASNGQDAINKIESYKFDCLFTDLMMPGMDGFTLLKELVKKSLCIPTVVYSADVQDKVKEEVLNLGAKAFLNKPITKEELFNILSKIL